MDNKGKLREALLSGEFEQGQGELRTPNDQYCCLGVACEVFRRETGRGEWVLDGGMWVFVVDDQESSAILPDVVAEWFGFDEPNPRLKDDTKASVFNDLYDYSFEKIAELI